MVERLLHILQRAFVPKRRSCQAALAILQHLSTPEAYKALKNTDPKDFTTDDKEVLEKAVHKSVLEPVANPRIIHSDCLKIFDNILKGDPLTSIDQVESQQDGERNVISVLDTGDLPILRKARRLMMTSCTRQAIKSYDALTRMIATIAWRTPAPKK